MSKKSSGWGQWFRVKLSHDEAQALYRRCDEQSVSPEALLRQAFVAFTAATPCTACHCHEKAQQAIGDPRVAVGRRAPDWCDDCPDLPSTSTSADGSIMVTDLRGKTVKTPF